MRGLVPGLASPYPLGEILPSLYRDDYFAQNLCGGLDEVLAPIIATLDSLPAYLDPATAPDDMLGWLAGWMGIVLDGHQTAERQRELVQEGVDILQWRGTVRGVRAAVDRIVRRRHRRSSSPAGRPPRSSPVRRCRVPRPPNWWSGSASAIRRVSMSAGWTRWSRCPSPRTCRTGSRCSRLPDRCGRLSVMAEPSEQLALDWSDGLFEVADEKRRTVAAGRSSVEVPAAEPIATERSAVPDPVLVATDGSCLRNPGGPTGWAWVRADGAWASGGRPEGTNQIGELLAVVLALTDHPDVPLEIQCDSSYAIGCATTWKKGWQRNNYVNSQKKVVSNLEIIQQLHRLIDARRMALTFTKVKGHDLTNRWPLNTAVDVVCGDAAAATQASGTTVSASRDDGDQLGSKGFAQPGN